LAVNIFYLKGDFQFILSRYNPDNDYLIRHTTPSPAYPDTPPKERGWNNKTILAFGIKTDYFFSKYINLTGGIIYSPILNNHYNFVTVHNIHIELGNKIRF
jgi:hypothetical protein